MNTRIQHHFTTDPNTAALPAAIDRTTWQAELDALRDAGADVVIKERVGSHGGAFWRKEFPLMVVWAFGRE